MRQDYASRATSNGPVVCVCVCVWVCLLGQRPSRSLACLSVGHSIQMGRLTACVGNVWRAYSPPIPANLRKLCKLTIKLKRYIIITRDRARWPAHDGSFICIFSRKHMSTVCGCRLHVCCSDAMKQPPPPPLPWSKHFRGTVTTLAGALKFLTQASKNAPLRRGQFQSIIHDYYQLTHADICNCRAIHFHYGRAPGRVK